MPFLLQNHKPVILSYNNITLKHPIWHFRWNVRIAVHLVWDSGTLPTTLKQVLLLPNPMDKWKGYPYFHLQNINNVYIWRLFFKCAQHEGCWRLGRGLPPFSPVIASPFIHVAAEKFSALCRLGGKNTI